MTIAEHFDRYIAARLRIDAVKRQLKDLENAAEPDAVFIKEWFRARPEKRSNRGVTYSATTQRRLDVTKARLLLGKKAAEAEREIPVEALGLDKESKAVRDAAGLKPVRGAERATA